MIRVLIPNNNIPERKYIINVLFSEFLGLQYSLDVSGTENNYLISFDECLLIVKDGFFCYYQEPLSYISATALPEKIVYSKNEFTTENDIPVIFGTEELLVSDKKIICGTDLFASSYFMLSRWEEVVSEVKDKHNRFPGSESIAFKNDFLDRPVVNEYVEMLWNMIRKLGYKGERKPRNFELVLTHDVDALSYVTFRSVLGDLLKRKNLKLASRSIKYLFNDPYDTFDFLMTMSENMGVKSHFYFTSTNSKLRYDTGYYLNRKKFISTLKKIKSRGHITGFHPGYYTYDDPERWRSEKQQIEATIKQEINEGRQHFLRMDVSKTLRIWEDNKMKIDSTLGYADKEGFRCGTGDTYTLFDFLERKQFRLKECPLIVMDSTLKHYQQYSKEHALKVIQYYISVGKRYNSPITFLIHNSSFFGDYEDYYSVLNLNISIPADAIKQ